MMLFVAGILNHQLILFSTFWLGDNHQCLPNNSKY